MIDWWLAERVAGVLAGPGPSGRIGAAALTRHTREAHGLVTDYTGLEAKGRIPAAELVSREEWIAANLGTIQELTAGLDRDLDRGIPVPGPLGSVVRAGTGMALGAQIGLASAFLAQRVLGQYDIALVGPDRPARLLFVRPNLIAAHRGLGGEREVLLRWIALHEATHAVQFRAVPWLRDHLGGLVRELIAQAEAGPRIELSRLPRLLRSPDPRRLARALRELPAMVAPTRRQRELLASLQASMAVVEGYSEHVMDAVGAELGSGYGELRERLERRRDSRSLLEQVISALLGLNLKLRQYRLGKRFSDEVVEREGLEALNLVWRAPEDLPTPYELEHPARWLARVA